LYATGPTTCTTSNGPIHLGRSLRDVSLCFRLRYLVLSSTLSPSQISSCAAPLPEGAGGTGGPGSATSAAPISQSSRRLPLRGSLCREAPSAVVPAVVRSTYLPDRSSRRQVHRLTGSQVGVPPVFEPAVIRQSAGLGHTVV
jgi:hypothetical protein